MKTIEKFGTDKLLVGAFAQLNRGFINFILPISLALLRLEELFPPYREAVEKFELLVNKTLRLPLTREITEHDAYRDRLLRRFFNLLKDFRKSINADEKHNGTVVWEAVSAYEGIMDNEMNKQTSMILGMLRDLNAPLVKEAVEMLKLDDLVMQIQVCNDELEVALLKRVEILNDQVDVKTKEQRKIVNKLREPVIQRINAVSNLESDPVIDELVGKINTLFGEYNRMAKHMRAGGTGNEKISKKNDE